MLLIAVEMFTHVSKLYLYGHIGIHLYTYGIINLHVLAIPVHDQHAMDFIFYTATKAMDNLYPSQKDTIIRISTYREKNITGHILGVATLYIWCAAHHLGLVFRLATLTLVTTPSIRISQLSYRTFDARIL